MPAYDHTDCDVALMQPTWGPRFPRVRVEGEDVVLERDRRDGTWRELHREVGGRERYEALRRSPMRPRYPTPRESKVGFAARLLSGLGVPWRYNPIEGGGR